jgi:hypothetical protein
MALLRITIRSLYLWKVEGFVGLCFRVRRMGWNDLERKDLSVVRLGEGDQPLKLKVESQIIGLLRPMRNLALWSRMVNLEQAGENIILVVQDSRKRIEMKQGR